MNAKKCIEEARQPLINPVTVLEGPYRRQRLGIFGFLKWLFSTSDMDYAVFERLESKRTRHQIERERYS